MSTRALGPPDPLDLPPRSTAEPNLNDPVGSVGPDVPLPLDPSSQPTDGVGGGYGAQHVIYPGLTPPPEAMAWAGWPSEWAVPWDNGGTLGGLVGTDIVWTCVDKNATAVASMPAAAIDGNGIPLAQQPTWLLNPQPEVYATWAEFVRQIWWCYQLTGEVFIGATSRYLDSGYPRTFAMLAPWLVNAEIVDGVRRVTINGEDTTGDVLHIRYVSWPGDARGHGPLEAAGDRLLAVKVLMRYGADLAANGGIPWAVLKHKYKLQEGQATELKAQWIAAAHSRMGAPAVLDSDTELQQLQTTPKDMSLSEMQQFAESRIAVILGLPPFLVGLAVGCRLADICQRVDDLRLPLAADAPPAFQVPDGGVVVVGAAGPDRGEPRRRRVHPGDPAGPRAGLQDPGGARRDDPGRGAGRGTPPGPAARGAAVSGTRSSPIMRYFETRHLPAGLAVVSTQFRDLAEWVEENLPAGAEKSTALRKLLEAKDAAVRAALPGDDSP